MAMIVSALVLSLSFLGLAGLSYVYRSPQRFPSFAGGRYSGFAAVGATCLFGQGIAMSVANAAAASSLEHAVSAGMVVTAFFIACRIASLSRQLTALPEFEPFMPAMPDGPAPTASNSNNRKRRRRKAA